MPDVVRSHPSFLIIKSVKILSNIFLSGHNCFGHFKETGSREKAPLKFFPEKLVALQINKAAILPRVLDTAQPTEELLAQSVVEESMRSGEQVDSQGRNGSRQELTQHSKVIITGPT